MRSGAAFGVVVTALAQSSVQPAAAAGPPPEPEHVITIDPTSGPPGTPVEVSGSCPVGWSAMVSLHSAGDLSVRPLQGFGGDVRTEPAADGSYVVTLTIPAEASAGPWQFTAACSTTDASSHRSTADFTVTGGAGLPLTIDWRPQPARTGEVLHVSGDGCLVDAAPLRDVIVRVFDQFEDFQVTAEVQADDRGHWVADLALPSGVALADARLLVECSSIGDPVSWALFINVHLAVAAGPPPTTAAPPTTQSTVLARTGAASNTATSATGVLLVGAVVVLVVAARRRRAVLPTGYGAGPGSTTS